MERSIHYSIEPPNNFEQLLDLYHVLGWNSLKLTVNELEQMCNGSWYAVYAYDEDRLVGMGRVISDGIITGVICGVCVMPSYQCKGIGKEIVNKLTQHCLESRVIPQLMCVEGMESYYEAMGFKRFTIGMKKDMNR